MSQRLYDPDKWLTSFTRALKDYVSNGLGLTGAESDPYEIEMSYPDVDALPKRMPLQRTLIHFELDDPRIVPFGFGENVVDRVLNLTDKTTEEWEAHCHEVDVDVGVWASVESGGPTARMEAREELDRLFIGPAAIDACMTATDGVEIRDFTGGLFVIDLIDDIKVFRIVNQTLRVRVYSRKKINPIPYIDQVEQVPDLMLDETIHITG